MVKRARPFGRARPLCMPLLVACKVIIASMERECTKKCALEAIKLRNSAHWPGVCLLPKQVIGPDIPKFSQRKLKTVRVYVSSEGVWFGCLNKLGNQVFVFVSLNRKQMISPYPDVLFDGVVSIGGLSIRQPCIIATIHKSLLTYL